MNKLLVIITVSLAVGLVTIYSNQYFEDKIMSQDKKILGISSEERFILPFPKEYENIFSVRDQRNTKIIINVKKPASEIRDFYKEILRSKEYENDYEYEKDNIIEFRYLKDSEDLKITITQEGDSSLVEFNYHN